MFRDRDLFCGGLADEIRDWGTAMRRTILTVLASIIVLWGTAVASLGAELPRAQLDESERHFTRAYAYFLERDYWNTLDYLDRALKANTYLVDYYLLKGLTADRTGDFEGARKALASYLEVRAMDRTAPRVLNWLLAQERMLRSLLSPLPVAARWQFSQPDLQEEWRTGILRPFNVEGLGKVEALDAALCVSDTLGNKLYLGGGEGDGFRSVPVPAPAVTLPVGDGTFFIFSVSGDIRFFSDVPGGNVSLDLKGHVDSHIADASWVSETEFAVADPVARTVDFYDRESLRHLASWAPPDGEMLFEPVGLSRYANWLAVADRGNGRVYLLDAVSRREFFFAEVPMPRDVAWSPLGELFTLSEKGEIFRAGLDFERREVRNLDRLEAGLQDAWALFPSSQGDLYCLDVAASRLVKATMLPSRDTEQGFLGLFAPVLALDKDKESFLVEAAVGTPFVSYFRNTAEIVHAVWNERTLRSSMQWMPQAPLDALLLHRSLPAGYVLPPTLRAVRVESGQDVRIALPPLWSLHRGTLTNLIVDSSLLLSQDEVAYLTRFCLENGLRLDVWARDIPSLALTRAGAFTGGTAVFSMTGPPRISAPRSRVRIQIPLPRELSSSGYPSRSMLAVYLDIGLVQMKGWIPLWPDTLFP